MSESSARPVRRIVSVCSLLLSLVATVAYGIAIAGGNHLNVFEMLSLPLFSLLFGWIVFSFLLALIGIVDLYRRPSHMDSMIDSTDGSFGSGDPAKRSAVKTAIVMPIYNESPERVFAGIEAMWRSLEAICAVDRFDFYILSDSTNSEVWLAEELAWSELVERLVPHANVFYRHRAKNVARKAGNIADFCSRWGSRYRYMIVLDADSLVAAETMVTLVQRMDADEQLGILQVPPTPIGRHSLFARLQQFSAHLYGPTFVAGFARWAGDDGNYWGHNAIIRIKPFLRHCALPVLPGAAPLGGEILSHDFVEAALMLKAGWKVQLATDLGGSFEECPTTITDYAIRDQRWCQGNLQHAKLLIGEGYRPLSRMHFASGVMSYVASPIWMLFTLLCIVGTIVDRLAGGRTSVSENYPIALSLFVVSMLLLLTPKVASGFLSNRRGRQRQSSRALPEGRDAIPRNGWSIVIEIISSILLSPLMAIYHTRFVLATLRGTNVKWAGQNRDDVGVSWRDAVRRHAVTTIASITIAIMLLVYAPTFLVWFSPLLAGLVVSIPLDVIMGSQRVGNLLRRHRLLLIPEEIEPSELKQRYDRSLMRARKFVDGDAPLFDRLLLDPKLFHLHRQIQMASEANIALPISQRKAIEAAYSEHGATGIPSELRSSILGDAATLLALHLETQAATPPVPPDKGNRNADVTSVEP